MILEIVAILASGLFAGAAIYITFVEHPARLACGPALAVREFASSYRRATFMQAPLAILGFLAAIGAYWEERHGAFLFGGFLLGMVVPFTLIFITPNNRRLLAADLRPDSGEAEALLRRWGVLHVTRSGLGGLAFGILLFCAASMASDTRAADEAAIRAADAEWARAVRAKDLERTVSFYADDATVLPVSEPIVSGKEAIRSEWSHIFAIPGFDATSPSQITRLEISRAGDLAYAQGTYEVSLEDTAGMRAMERGKWVVVWKKQTDGTWKIFAEIYNTDSPPPTHR